MHKYIPVGVEQWGLVGVFLRAGSPEGDDPLDLEEVGEAEQHKDVAIIEEDEDCERRARP